MTVHRSQGVSSVTPRPPPTPLPPTSAPLPPTAVTKPTSQDITKKATVPVHSPAKGHRRAGQIEKVGPGPWTMKEDRRGRRGREREREKNGETRDRGAAGLKRTPSRSLKRHERGEGERVTRGEKKNRETNY